jgi:hypothetical protein
VPPVRRADSPGDALLTAPERREPTAPGAATLSVAVMTAGPGPRVAALLRLLRPAADEILVALDDRAGDEIVAELSQVADRVVLYPFAEPVDRPLAWLCEQCRSHWVLLIDDDEIPSAALVEALPELVQDDRLTHYWIPRRWLFPDSSAFLDEPPWRPDYQLRLIRRDPRSVYFSDEFHRPIVAQGPGRFLETPLWHADPLVRTHAQRLEKARRYERERPGMRIAGRSLNFAFYVPEFRPDARRAPVPPREREAIDSVLHARPHAGEARADVRPACRDEIDAHWPGNVGPRAYAARLEVLERPTPIRVLEQQTLDVRVENLGDREWEWGVDAPLGIRLAARWLSPDGEPADAPALRTAFPAPIPPGAADLVPVHILAPSEPGRYRVEIDLVQEHVRWFDQAVSVDVDVLPRRRVAIVGAEEDALRLLELAPAVEPVLIQPEGAHRPEGFGYAATPDLHAYLLDAAPARGLQLALRAARRAARLARAARRVRKGRPAGPLPRGADSFLEQLAGCERLIVADLGGPPFRREFARVLAIVKAARILRIPVAISADALPPNRLAAVIRRQADLVYRDLSEVERPSA